MIDGFERQKNLFQNGIVAVQAEMTPLEKKLLFDYPQYLVNLEEFFKSYPVRTFKELSPEGEACLEKVKNVPTWKGVVDLWVTRSWNRYHQIPDGTLFGKIRQGEIWRLITPALLHGGLLHLLFNMAWVWMLGKMVEPRLGALRYFLLSLVIGLVSNVAQYLMSGPEFLGYSGIVVGMVGFIWMRQKTAPWEGYPLDRGVVRFMAIYVFGLTLIGIVSLALDYFRVTEIYVNIANTAHLVGGATGMVCGRLGFFRRGSR
jgi:GlpG protein